MGLHWSDCFEGHLVPPAAKWTQTPMTIVQNQKQENWMTARMLVIIHRTPRDRRRDERILEVPDHILGDNRLSRVPESPLQTHAPLIGPRWCPVGWPLLRYAKRFTHSDNAFRTAVFQVAHTVDFGPDAYAPRLSLRSTTIPISGLNHAACVLASPASYPIIRLGKLLPL
jgi:hypothetical protein